MPLPTGDPTTLNAVKAWLSIAVGDDRDDAAIQLAVDAVNVLVRGLPVAQRASATEAVEEWPSTIKLGATMLAARIKRRQNTPGGVEVAGEFGIAYVRRNDPDVAQMLELGEYSRPAVG